MRPLIAFPLTLTLSLRERGLLLRVYFSIEGAF